MIALIARKIKSYLIRKKNSKKFGLNYHRAQTFTMPNKILYKNALLDLAFPSSDQSMKEVFVDIFLDDTYGIIRNEQKYKTIIDIGGNIGFTSVLASLLNKDSTIHLYEPNPLIHHFLEFNLKKTNVKIFKEAVGLKSGHVDLCFVKESSIHAQTVSNNNGKIVQTGFSECINRINGIVDFLKMDCEGAEWEILKDLASFRKVREICLEYHLDPDQNRSLNGVMKLLENMDFTISKIRNQGTFGIICAFNSKLK